MELETSPTYRLYKALYKARLMADSVEEFFAQARVPLDSDIANDPIVRRRVESQLRIERIITKWEAIGWTLVILLPVIGIFLPFVLYGLAILFKIVVAVLGIMGYTAFYTTVHFFVVPNPDISNQTIAYGLEDCNAIGNFEWTVIITSEHSQCSGALIHPNYVLTAGKLLKHNM